MLLIKQKSADFSCNQLIYSIFVISRTIPNQFEAKNNAKVGGQKKFGFWPKIHIVILDIDIWL